MSPLCDRGPGSPPPGDTCPLPGVPPPTHGFGVTPPFTSQRHLTRHSAALTDAASECGHRPRSRGSGLPPVHFGGTQLRPHNDVQLRGYQKLQHNSVKRPTSCSRALGSVRQSGTEGGAAALGLQSQSQAAPSERVSPSVCPRSLESSGRGLLLPGSAAPLTGGRLGSAAAWRRGLTALRRGSRSADPRRQTPVRNRQDRRAYTLRLGKGQINV